MSDGLHQFVWHVLVKFMLYQIWIQFIINYNWAFKIQLSSWTFSAELMHWTDLFDSIDTKLRVLFYVSYLQCLVAPLISYLQTSHDSAEVNCVNRGVLITNLIFTFNFARHIYLCRDQLSLVSSFLLWKVKSESLAHTSNSFPYWF